MVRFLAHGFTVLGFGDIGARGQDLQGAGVLDFRPMASGLRVDDCDVFPFIAWLLPSNKVVLYHNLEADFRHFAPYIYT